MAAGRAKDAVAEFKTAQSLQDTNVIRTHLADAQYKAGDPQGAEATLKPWIAAHENDSMVRVALGDMYLAEGQYADAELQYEEIVKRAPGNYIAENNLAWTLMQLNRPMDALGHARHAATVAPNSGEVLDTLGSVLLQNGNTNDAARALQRANQLAPGNPEIQFHLAQALVGLGEKDQARKVLDTLLTPKANFKDREEAQKLLVQLGG